MRRELIEAGQGWAQGESGRRRLGALAALCDTWVPSVRPPRGAPSGDGFWRLQASDLDVHVAVAGWLATRVPRGVADEAARLLDGLAATGYARLPLAARASLLSALTSAAGTAGAGIKDLRRLVLLLHYGLAEEGGGNPTWDALGYPGPPRVTAPPEPPIRAEAPQCGDDPLELAADVCVVGSGAGGAVTAAVLAEAGLDVVVLEAGDDLQERDFPALELPAVTAMYWRGGYSARTADGNVTLLAGSTLGGGTTVNWSNCVRPPEGVLAAWATRHGLTDVDDGGLDQHVDAVLRRIGATDSHSDRNGQNDALRRGAERQGWSWRPALRNADPDAYSAETAGHMGFGDRSGSKQGTTRTYLTDAVHAGARVMVRCRADRILTCDGRAAGVSATGSTRDGGSRPVAVRAAHVVVAAGALETPALLLRSGLGGPAAGRHLRLHPVAALVGFYDQPQRTWWGPPQSVVVDQFADPDGHGFLVECPHYGTALSAATLPWRSGRDHKLLMGALDRAASFIGIVGDRGHGTVTLDADGNGVVGYPLTEERDRAQLRRAFGQMARLHESAGAAALVDLGPRRSLWRRGQDLERWITRTAGLSMGARGRPLFSAHQMGSARMGTDPDASAANPEGQLHDAPGVWIGDTSAFPTAVGVNPMVTCMALARRTAHALLATRP